MCKNKQKGVEGQGELLDTHTHTERQMGNAHK